jgi:hypothetical protein
MANLRSEAALTFRHRSANFLERHNLHRSCDHASFFFYLTSLTAAVTSASIYIYLPLE